MYNYFKNCENISSLLLDIDRTSNVKTPFCAIFCLESCMYTFFHSGPHTITFFTNDLTIVPPQPSIGITEIYFFSQDKYSIIITEIYFLFRTNIQSFLQKYISFLRTSMYSIVVTEICFLSQDKF